MAISSRYASIEKLLVACAFVVCGEVELLALLQEEIVRLNRTKVSAKNTFFIIIPFLPYCTGEGYGLAQDADVVHFFIPVYQRFVHRVFRLQGNVVLVELDPL